MKLLDVSHHQQPTAVDYAAARSRGFVGVIARATYGIKPDETFDDHVRLARAAGLAVGAYHFFRQQQDAAAQARAFHDTVSAVGYGVSDILPALDLEDNTAFDGAPSATLYNRSRAIADDWLRRYAGAMIYFSPAFWTAMGRPQWWLDGPIWIAHHDVAAPVVPRSAPWAIWQFGKSPLPGVYTAADIDQNVARDPLPLIAKVNPQLSSDADTERFIPATGASGRPGGESGADGAGAGGPRGGPVSGAGDDVEPAPGLGAGDAADQATTAGSVQAMTANDRLATSALAVVAAGPMGNTKRGDEYQAWLEPAFGNGKELRKKRTSCAVFVGAVRFHAGLAGKRGWPKINGITTWAGVSWFDRKRDWIPNDGNLLLRRGDVPYWSGSPSDLVVEDDLNGHVGVLIEGSGWMWQTAEGGGGDGTECRLSAKPKDVRKHGTRPLRGVWRADGVGAVPSKLVTPIPVNPPKPAGPSTAKTKLDPVREWQSALADLGLYAGKIDGVFGPKTLDASWELLPRDVS